VSGLSEERRLRLLLGAGCLALGGILIADPFGSVSALAGVAAASLLITGTCELLDARRRRGRGAAIVAGVALIVAGLLAAAWSTLTLAGLALVLGAGLLISGIARLAGARAERGDRRLPLVGSGLIAAAGGALALSWQGIDVLALALIVGVCAAVYGVALLVGAWSPAGAGAAEERASPGTAAGARHGALLRAAALGVLVLAFAGMGLSIALHAAASPRPGPFYAPPSPLPRGPHGALIREEPIPGFYEGAKAYRILYRSTGFDGRQTAVSGVVIVPEGRPPRGGRKVIAFTHATAGVARSCAPSLRDGGASQVIEGLGGFIAAGYVVVATDYAGLGTPGPHPYLVGPVEAMNALDGVRAAHRLREADAGLQFAVWGHSQGGQASLFAARLADDYAPELHLVGVAAGAPTPDLPEMFKHDRASPGARILLAMALSSWSQLYPDAGLGRVLTPSAQSDVAAVAASCLYGNGYLAALPAARALGSSFGAKPPWQAQPWRRIMAQNSPGPVPAGVPVLIVQGGADRVVPSGLTAALVHRMCRAGDTVELRLYPSVEHGEAGLVASPDVAAWIARRFAGQPAPTSCG
jgi:uncharacterized membrane protein HdeD (DUF308 family)/alpha-beta hydrolase superfamily lysophospholipase